MSKTTLAFLLCGVLACPAPLAAWTLEKQTFDIKASPFTQDELARATRLQEGDDTSDTHVAEAKTALESLGVWKNLSVRKEIHAGRLSLTWQGEAFPLVREIVISGNYPVLTKRLKQAIRLRIGDPYDATLLDSYRQRIQEVYASDGYFNTEVHIKPHFLDDRRVRLTFKIKRGRSYRWGEIECRGNRFFSCHNINNRVRDFLHFRPKRLDKALRKLEEKYHRAGFSNAKINVVKVDFDDKKRTATPTLRVSEGTRLEFHWQGNRSFKKKKLLEISNLLDRPGQASEWQIKRATSRILSAYQAKGFPETDVEVHITERDENTKTVSFEIEEGKRVKIQDIQFAGRDKMGKGDLVAVLALKREGLLVTGPFYKELLEEDRARLEALYRKSGFLEAAVGTPELIFSRFKDKVKIRFPIQEGPRFHVGDIAFKGSVYFDAAKLLKISKLAPKQAATRARLEKAKERILLEYSKYGYPYAEVAIVETPRAPLVDLSVEITEGTRVTLDQILVLGQFRTRKKFILKAMNTPVRVPLDLPQLFEGKLALRHFNSYQSIDLDLLGIRERRDHVTGLLRLEERPELSNEIRIGYDTDQYWQGKYTLHKRSLFGTGQQLYLDLEGGQRLSRASISHLIPRIHGWNWNVSETAFIQYDNDVHFNAFSFGGFLNAVRQFTSWLSLNITPGIEDIDVKRIDSTALAQRRPKDDSTLGTLTATVNIDRRDHFSDPRRGFLSNVVVEYDQDVKEAKNSFFVNTVQFAVFRKLVSRLSLWNNIRFDRIYTIASDTQIPPQKLFFLGGNDTIRGFDDDAVNASGGTLRLFSNTELHFAFTPTVKLAAFLDSGSLTDEFNEISRKTIRHSAGPGLRYFTPIGPLRFDYGFILDRGPAEPRGRFHFSFGFFF